MVTMASTVTAVRRLLQDRPLRVDLAAAITDTSTKTFTVAAADIRHFTAGQTWEHDDGSASAELRIVEAVDTATNTVTAERGAHGSTAATHADASYILKEPRFTYDICAQAISTVIDAELYQAGIYEIVEHELTASATTNLFNAPSSACEEFLRIYYRLDSNDDFTDIKDFSRALYNVDTDLYANGRYAVIHSQPVAGTTMYVNCKHKLTVTTLSAAQERITHLLACAYLLEWTEPKRTAGPSNQGDRTVRVGSGVGTAAYYRTQAERLIAKERSYLKRLNPPYRVWLRD
jgi:hypothetical protein